MKLITYEWNDKKFTSQDRLHSLFLAGQIDCIKAPCNSFRTQYTYFTKQGEHIASFTKDDTFGFCSQACGIELGSTKPS